jgi:UDP-N-acetylglucosamine/UDP-N-acetylgalactosamine diphosphorylase
MGKEDSVEKLRSIGQLHIFKYFDTLSPEQQLQLIDQVNSINTPAFRMQQQMLLQHPHHTPRFLDVFDKIKESGNRELALKGQKLIEEGKVGCLFIAGGMGSRLHFDGPKGMFPISLIQKKTPFQIFAEKTIAAGKQCNRVLSIAVMTSPLNHNQTVHYFEENKYFGLEKGQIDFFCQKMLPFLDHDGNLFLDNIDHLAEGPDGNGSSLQEFYKSGIWKKWYDNGVRYLNYVLIDNLLADPFDAELAGFHQSEGVDIVIKCTSRENPEENVGVIIEMEDKVRVIEYSELPQSERLATNANGQLKHIAANLSLFSFSMDFIHQHANDELPLHLAHKATEYVNEDGISVKSKKPNAWKYEKFIFDVLPLAWSIKALLYPRESCFAPLKNDHGTDSPTTVQKALQDRDRQVIEEITGLTAPERPFELDQAFYYPTPELLDKWKGKSLPEETYIKENSL